MPTLPGLQEMASQLVAIPSVSSTVPQFDMGNRAVVDQLAQWLESLGFDVSVMPLAGREGKANLIARLGEGVGGLVLSGHTDTVPFDEHLWQSDPFTITERDQRWYGLGTCDMKCFFALAIVAAAGFADRKLARPLTIIATADEESTMSGARALAAADLCGAQFALIGEPTNLAPVSSHKGIMMLEATLKGASGHSSNPALGISALDETATLIQVLANYRDELTRRYQDDSFEVAVPTMNLGCIHGGDNPNRICDHVNLAFDVRVLPGMDSEAVISELGDRLDKAFSNLDVGHELALLNPYIPPFINEDEDFAKLCEELTDSDRGPVAFATEAPFFSALGMQTIVMGPGSIDQAHQPNEYLPLDQVDRTIDIIRSLIHRICLPS